MSTERSSDDARRALEALGALRAPRAADPGFRTRLRREFAHGAVGPVRPAARAPVELHPAHAVLRLGWIVTGAAAAVALVAIGIALLNPGPAWRVVSASGSGSVRVGDRELPLADPAALSAAMIPGAVVRVPGDASLEIASARTIAIAMQGGTEATLPRVPGRWFDRQVRGSIRAGEWRITTGPDFPGAQLAIETPSAHVEVTGTTLAVLCLPEGTCVCVYEGHVRVGHGADDLVVVDGGRRRLVYNDRAQPPLDDAMLPQERPALGSFCRIMRPAAPPPR
ncbi:MAG TPA: hypothetical protein VMH61_05345 [Candidatus Acidoferrales bacterium]|nr:hypothetical protein [Candidatus Acidoferrales bacterium]